VRSHVSCATGIECVSKLPSVPFILPRVAVLMTRCQGNALFVLLVPNVIAGLPTGTILRVVCLLCSFFCLFLVVCGFHVSQQWPCCSLPMVLCMVLLVALLMTSNEWRGTRGARTVLHVPMRQACFLSCCCFPCAGKHPCSCFQTS
jgi:hypothetical protein